MTIISGKRMRHRRHPRQQFCHLAKGNTVQMKLNIISRYFRITSIADITIIITNNITIITIITTIIRLTFMYNLVIIIIPRLRSQTATA